MRFIEPYVTASTASPASLGQGNTLIMMIMMVVVMLFPFSFLTAGAG